MPKFDPVAPSTNDYPVTVMCCAYAGRAANNVVYLLPSLHGVRLGGSGVW